MRFSYFTALLASLYVFGKGNQETCTPPTANCVTFTVSSGTGCAWMCQYCASQLGTNNYYFTDGVCKYQEGQGCVGNPLAGVSYTCCQGST